MKIGSDYKSKPSFLTYTLYGIVSYIPTEKFPAFLKENRVSYLERVIPYTVNPDEPDGDEMIKDSKQTFDWLETAFFYTNDSFIELRFRPSRECFILTQLFTNTQATEYTFNDRFPAGAWGYSSQFDTRKEYVRFKRQGADIKAYQLGCFVPDMNKCFFVDIYVSPVQWKGKGFLVVTYMFSYPGK